MGSDDEFLHPIKLITYCIVADYKCILLPTAICNVRDHISADGKTRAYYK